MNDFYSDSSWLSVPVSRGRTACGWAEHRWPNWLGGYKSWSRDKHPTCNQWKFSKDCDELRMQRC